MELHVALIAVAIPMAVVPVRVDIHAKVDNASVYRIVMERFVVIPMGVAESVMELVERLITV
jgi:hypothetical protein